MAAARWLKGRSVIHNRAHKSPHQGRTDPQKIPRGTDLTTNRSKEFERLQQLLWALHTLLWISLLMRETGAEATALPSLVPSCLQRQQEVFNIFTAFLSTQGKLKRTKKSYDILPERRVTALLEPVHSSHLSNLSKTFSIFWVWRRTHKKSRMGIFPWTSSLPSPLWKNSWDERGGCGWEGTMERLM